MPNIDVNDDLAVLKTGYKALTDALGSSGFIKFMELVTVGQGDYTKEKYEKPEEFISWNQLEQELSQNSK